MITLMFSLILLLSILVLGIILLLFFFSVPAYAAEPHYIDSGFEPWLWEETQGDPPGDELPEPGEREDPGELPGDEEQQPGEEEPDWEDEEDPGGLLESEEPEEGESSGDRLESESGTLSEDVTQIRQMLELLIFFVFPFICALWLVYKFCMWFYYTFIRSVL